MRYDYIISGAGCAGLTLLMRMIESGKLADKKVLIADRELKPRNDRDWADNVYREGLVSYDLGLWVGALDVMAKLGATSDPALARRAKDAAASARKTIDRKLWTDTHQGYADYATPDGFVEDHLVLDSLTLARYDAVPQDKALRLLRSMERTLETRHNAAPKEWDRVIEP